MTICCEIADRIATVPSDEWDALFAGELESHAYLRAFEEARPDGFDLRYLLVRDRHGLVGACPAFMTSYRLDATVQGRWKRLTQRLFHVAPWLLRVPVVCLGSPASERLAVGYRPGAKEVVRIVVFEAILKGLERLACEADIGLIGIKDVPFRDAIVAAEAASRMYHVLPSLPTAVLPLPFSSFDAYLASLGPATRKDLRRKARAASAIRIEWRTDVTDVLGRIGTLYEQVLGRSDLQFERMTPAYFQGVLAARPANAACALYWHGEDLLAFNLVLRDSDRMVDKFFCMDAARGRRFNLYFLSWMTNVKYCLDAGIRMFQSGQSCYEPKLRLGSRLEPNAVYFRHRKPIADGVLRIVAHFARPDRHDPALRHAAPPNHTATPSEAP